MEGWILSFQRTLFYQQFLAELPAPLNNVYLDLLILGLLAVYLLYCIVSDVVDWAWIGKVSKAGKRERKGRSVNTDGEGDGAETALMVKASGNGAEATFYAEAQSDEAEAANNTKAQNVLADETIPSEIQVNTETAAPTVKSRISQIWIKRREIEALREEIGTPGKLTKAETLERLNRIAEIKEEVERIKWEMEPKGEDGPVQMDAPEVGAESTGSAEEERGKNGCVSTLDSGIREQCPVINENMPACGQSEFDRLMEQYSATQKAIGMLEGEFGEERRHPAERGRDGTGPRRIDESNDTAVTDELRALGEGDTAEERLAAGEGVTAKNQDNNGKSLMEVPGTAEKDFAAVIQETSEAASANEAKQKPKTVGKISDQEVTAILLQGLACTEVLEIANLEESLRIAAVRAALSAGASTRQVARLTGISKSAVQRMGAK